MKCTVGEIADLIFSALAKRGINMEVTHGATRLGDVRRNFADTSKAKYMLGWEPIMSLHEGIDQTIDYFV